MKMVTLLVVLQTTYKFYLGRVREMSQARMVTAPFLLDIYRRVFSDYSVMVGRNVE